MPLRPFRLVQSVLHQRRQVQGTRYLGTYIVMSARSCSHWPIRALLCHVPTTFELHHGGIVRETSIRLDDIPRRRQPRRTRRSPDKSPLTPTQEATTHFAHDGFQNRGPRVQHLCPSAAERAHPEAGDQAQPRAYGASSYPMQGEMKIEGNTRGNKKFSSNWRTGALGCLKDRKHRC